MLRIWRMSAGRQSAHLCQLQHGVTIIERVTPASDAERPEADTSRSPQAVMEQPSGPLSHNGDIGNGNHDYTNSLWTLQWQGQR